MSHITVSDIMFSRPKLTVSQGMVVTSGAGYVTLMIDGGFPTPDLIENAPPPGYTPPSDGCGGNPYDSGRYLMRYDYTVPADPVPYGGDDHSGDKQVAWGWRSGAFIAPTVDGSGNWTIYYDNANQTDSAYTAGAEIAIKSKQSSQAYLFDNRPLDPMTGAQEQTATPQYGSDFIFNRIIWKRQARGTWRGGFTGLQVLNSETQRETVGTTVAALSSPAGGPQFNQPNDLQPASVPNQPQCYTTSNNRLDHWVAVGTGDDSAAFFSDIGTGANASVIQDSSMTESLARDLLLSNSTSIRETGVTAPYTLSAAATCTLP